MSSGKTVRGENGEGKSYQSMHSLWNEKLNGDPYDPKKGWYGKALSYWSKSPATINGVLGGFQEVHGDDIQESKAFITSLPDHGTGRALDCGAGIGRVTKHLLALMYDQTDVLEPVPHLLEQAKTELAGMRVGEFMQCSMENAVLQPNTYDLIVVQWAAIYLTDTDFVKFFSHCKAALTPRGYIFFKDNCANDSFIVDEADSSVIRCDSQYKALFAEAKLRVVKEAGQTQWPEGLLPQKMFALQ